MPKKTAKNTKTAKASRTTKSSKCASDSILLRPTTWAVAILLLALLVIYGISVYGFKNIDTKTALDSAKLNVFDDLIQGYVSDFEINSEKQSANEVTGYGISDEDGTFYATIDFAYYDADTKSYGDLQHAIIYFWEDKERGTYSHAFGYYDDDYHPSGVYTEIGDHYLRNTLQQGQ